ncbi:MAG: hypothetical protein CMM08_10800 [Rhodospirillaceae bacterium]|jgi:GNAT superfamily N-acetyltransferase/N-acetylglutamate synthase-like GNAT family acetyltransferase|nr:hypothetical protein [Rhodospirillaceae bacterium]|tara:strand:- start:1716 stop:2717 length:1002 start_codon:yes stop_codon:yes gene_type:complete
MDNGAGSGEQAMSNSAKMTVRPLVADDLDEVVEIDRQHTGRSRRDFFQRRIAAALDNPGEFVQVAIADDDDFAAFATARMLSGEFGSTEPAVSLDLIGVDQAHEGQGMGRRLLSGLIEVTRNKSIKLLQTEANWTNHDLLHFLNASGFTIGYRQVIERSTQERILDDGDDEDEFDETAVGEAPQLAHDRVPVRSLEAADIEALLAIDRRITNLDRSDYLRRKAAEALDESAVRVSLVAEIDGFPAGFVMARMDFGEHGRSEPAAVMDTIGTDPRYGFRGVGTALLSQLMMNLSALHVDMVQSTLSSSSFDLLAFLYRCGFQPSSRLAFTKRLD